MTLAALWQFLGVRGAIALGLAAALAFVCWRADGLSEKLDTARQTIAEMKAAQVVAEQAAQDAKAKAEADYRNLAERIDHDAEQARADALDAAELFIRNNRVQCPATGNPAGTAVAPAGDRDTGIPPQLPGDSLVAVRDDDVRACSAWVSYGIAAREWALELEQQNRD